jgi:hypothetical protein
LEKIDVKKAAYSNVFAIGQRVVAEVVRPHAGGPRKVRHKIKPFYLD